MGWALFVYILILFLNLIIGGTVLVWKCTGGAYEFGCQLAVSGTITGVAIWMLVVLVCPCFMSRCEICIMLDNMWKKFALFCEKIHQRNKGTLFSQKAITTPTTSDFKNGQDTSLLNSDDSDNESHSTN